MQTHTNSPFINVTSMGARSKITATAQTEEGMSFRQVLNAAQGKDSAISQGRRDTFPRGSTFRSELLEEANNDPLQAAKMAHDYAYNSLVFELLDVTDYPIIRYTTTGQIVTDETKLYFAKTMSSVQKLRGKLYETELLKGTPPAKILEKILDFNDSLPQKFKDMAHW
ncbi:hypothetical protein ALQ04_03781 [Pseudomonas cichorii]|uniref:Uncharacterized protein n=1 Tax=Pseudomonas cichorii TaxID=36746 RepID=A0A3M4LVM4_PSECI|nr:hypothetical protein [Pseudomonas cichorii]RMQ45526.1 hypothetical protein ALQ04_03781 [Pseudomonas cichorii]